MEVQPKFRLRSPNELRSLILLDVCWKGQRAIHSTGQSIDTILWDREKMRPYKRSAILKKYKGDEKDILLKCSRINNKLDKISGAVEDYLLKADTVPTVEDLKNHLNKIFHPNRIESRGTTLNDYINDFIDGIASGRRQTANGTKYASTTVNAYNGLRYRLNEFQKVKRKIYDFEDITMDFYGKFTAYLTSVDNKPSTAGKQIKCLKAILRAALDEKIHDHRDFQTPKFKVTKLESEAIYLTREELSRIAALDFSENPILDVARDVFLIGFHTGQRVSDYLRITDKHITKTGKGHSVLTLKQIKTGTKVIIPISKALNALLKKYGYSVPHIVDQKLNKRIKQIGEIAGITDDVQVTEYVQGKRVQKHVPKYTLIQSHTARRSAATLMVLADVHPNVITKITGHKTVDELMRYVRITEEQNADLLAIHPYYNPLQSLAV